MNDEGVWALLSALSRMADETRDIRHAIESLADEITVLHQTIREMAKLPPREVSQ